MPRRPRKTKFTNQINKFQKHGVEVEFDAETAEAGFVALDESTVDAADLGDVTVVASALNDAFELSGVTAGENLLFVLESQDTAGTFGMYLYVGTASDTTIGAADLRVLSIVEGDDVATTDFNMIA